MISFFVVVVNSRCWSRAFVGDRSGPVQKKIFFHETCNRYNIYLPILTFSKALSNYVSYIYINICLIVLISLR